MPEGSCYSSCRVRASKGQSLFRASPCLAVGGQSPYVRAAETNQIWPQFYPGIFQESYKQNYINFCLQ